MNWIKQNKFLTGFIAAMVIGVGALGYLLLKEQGRYSEVRADYETKVAELNRLETLKPYPDNDNLKAIEDQKTHHVSTIEALDKNVAAAQIPLEPLTREKFQDELREAVTRISTKAKDVGIGLPAPFYIGMDRYQTEPPLPEAAPVLGREVKAIELVLNKMIEAGIVSIGKFERDMLPEEEGKGKKEAPAKAGNATAGKAAKHSVAYHAIQLDFISDQGKFRNFLNSIVEEKSQFFVPRLVVVKNEKDSAPMRVDPGSTKEAKADSGSKAKVIFGSEKVEVTLVLDIVDFAEVASK